jgi:hypothetical protein
MMGIKRGTEEEAEVVTMKMGTKIGLITTKTKDIETMMAKEVGEVATAEAETTNRRSQK